MAHHYIHTIKTEKKCKITETALWLIYNWFVEYIGWLKILHFSHGTTAQHKLNEENSNKFDVYAFTSPELLQSVILVKIRWTANSIIVSIYTMRKYTMDYMTYLKLETLEMSLMSSDFFFICVLCSISTRVSFLVVVKIVWKYCKFSQCISICAVRCMYYVCLNIMKHILLPFHV